MLVTQNNEIVTCRYCGSTEINKCGSYRDTPRYFCKFCRRKFKLDDHLFYMRVPAEYIGEALNIYYGGMSINDIRDYLKQMYNYYPSKSVVYQWIEKYTDRAINIFKDYYPQVGDIWIVGETKLRVSGQNLWIYDVMDKESGFLLASDLVSVRDSHSFKITMQRACEKAEKSPNLSIAYMSYHSYDTLKYSHILQCQTDFIQNKPVIQGDNAAIFEFELFDTVLLFYRMLRARMRIMSKKKTLETAHKVLYGWLVSYNFLIPNSCLDGKTPAELAKVTYEIKSWRGISQIPTPEGYMAYLGGGRGGAN